MTIPQPAAGWYSDPVGYQRERYWDGSEWTGKVRNTGSSDIDRRSFTGYAARQGYSSRPAPQRYAHRPAGYPSDGAGRPMRDEGAPRRSHATPVGRQPYAPQPGVGVDQQLSIMPAALANAVMRELAGGSYLISSSPTAAIVGPRPVPHGLHLLATIITAGIWSVVWLGHTVSQAHVVRLTMDPVRGVVREYLPFRRSPYAA